MVRNQLPEEFSYHQDSIPNYNLPISVDKSSEQVEREMIYKTLLALKMDINELKNMKT